MNTVNGKLTIANLAAMIPELMELTASHHPNASMVKLNVMDQAISRFVPITNGVASKSASLAAVLAFTDQLVIHQNVELVKPFAKTRNY